MCGLTFKEEKNNPGADAVLAPLQSPLDGQASGASGRTSQQLALGCLP